MGLARVLLLNCQQEQGIMARIYKRKLALAGALAFAVSFLFTVVKL